MSIRILCCVLLMMLCANALAQTFLHGFIADSATLRPLPNVNIRLTARPHGSISDSQGHFSLLTTETDTLIFSIVGYHSKRLAVADFRKTGIVYMKEQQTYLKAVMVTPDVELIGIPRLEPETPYVNPTYTRAYTDTPGVPNIQTFAPSYIYKGIFSQFSKYERERKKLPKVRALNEKARHYIEAVDDPNLREELKNLYSLTGDEFYQTLTLFNERYSDSIYELEAKELTSLLHFFFAETHGRK